MLVEIAKGFWCVPHTVHKVKISRSSPHMVECYYHDGGFDSINAGSEGEAREVAVKMVTAINQAIKRERTMMMQSASPPPPPPTTSPEEVGDDECAD